MNRKTSLAADDFQWSRTRSNVKISSPSTSILSTPIGHNPDRTNKKLEDDGNRKRIRVACSRCRKRKIKCSGPIGGEDQPCQNCKNAAVQTTCAFEVAGSMRVGLDQNNRPQYPYALTAQLHYAGTGTGDGAYPYGYEGMQPQFPASYGYGYGQGQGLPPCNHFHSYPLSNTVPAATYYPGQAHMSAPIGHEVLPTYAQSQLTQWSPVYSRPGYDPYVEPLRHHQCSTGGLPSIAPLAQPSFPAMHNLASSLPEHRTPEVRYDIPPVMAPLAASLPEQAVSGLRYSHSANDLPTLTVPQEHRISVSWSSSDSLSGESLVSRADSNSSRYSLVDTASIQSSEVPDIHHSSQSGDFNSLSAYCGVPVTSALSTSPPRSSLTGSMLQQEEPRRNSSYLTQDDLYLALPERTVRQAEQDTSASLHSQPALEDNFAAPEPVQQTYPMPKIPSIHRPMAPKLQPIQTQLSSPQFHHYQPPPSIASSNQLNSRFSFAFSTPKPIAAPVAIMATGINRLDDNASSQERRQSHINPEIQEQTYNQLSAAAPKMKHHDNFRYEMHDGVKKSATKIAIASQGSARAGREGTEE